MAMNSLVSVIIPAFNRVDYIDQTVRSVLEQTYPSIELIVVDDGSSDGTFEKLQNYGGGLKLLTHQNNSNMGQSASINLGLRESRGKYIAILDSDDYWAYDKIEKQVAFLERHTDVGLVYTNGYGVDSDGNMIYSFYDERHIEQNDPNAVLLDCYILLPQSSLVRKSVFDKAGYFEDQYRAAQDHDMLIRIAEITELAYLPQYLFYYRRHANSISNKNQKLRWMNGFKILNNAQKRYSYKKSTIRKRKAVLNYRLGTCFLKERDYIASALYMLKAFIFDPVRALRVVFGIERRN
jgi:glycosyltransferase involved in cell wall biosynthesis